MEEEVITNQNAMRIDGTQPSTHPGSFIKVCGPVVPKLDGSAAGLAAPTLRTIVFAPLSPASATDRAVIAERVEGEMLGSLPGATSGESDLFIWSLPGLFSLARPLPALTALLPGLREVGHLKVERMDPKEIAERLVDLSGPVTLWIDLPGAEAEILDAFQAAGVLERVARLTLRCGVEPFFVGAQARPQLETRLFASDFVLKGVNDEDPDWPILEFAANPEARRIRFLEAALETAEQAATQREKALQEARSQAQKNAKKIAALEQELSIARSAEEEGGAALEELRATLAARDQALSELQAAVVASQTEIANHRAEAEESAQRVEGSAKRNEDLERQLAAAIAARDSAMRDAGLALRMQALLQSDIDELRDRFEQSERDRVRHEDLLRKLTPKLRDAARQLHAMEGSAPSHELENATNASVSEERKTPARKQSAPRSRSAPKVAK